jgi:hypothetical protein
MATASRSTGAKQRTKPPVAAMIAADALRTWVIPVTAAAAIVLFAAGSATGIMPTLPALAGAIVATLVLLLYVGERPLIAEHRPARDRAFGALLAVTWFTASYIPFHTRLFPGRPLVDAASVTAAGAGLPLRIPSAGARAIDLLLEGKLAPSPTGGPDLAVHYALTVEAGSGPRAIDGTFEDRLATRRLGRRGTATVHQAHTSDVRVLPNPEREDMTITKVVLEPATSQPVTISAFAHPLPAPWILGVATAVLLAVVVAFDRLGPVPETDGALTLATAAVVGTAVIFWTSNAVHPDFAALIGSVIFGGPLGFAVGALVWWMAKRLIVRPAR